MKHQLRIFVIAFFSFVLLPNSVYAADEPPGVAALLDAMERQYKVAGSARPTYSSIEPDGNGGAVITDLTWQMKQPEVEGSFVIGKVIVSGVSQRSSGAYSFKTIDIDNMVMKMDLPDVGPLVITIKSASTTNTHLLPQQSADGIDYSALLGAAVYEASTIPVINVSVAGQSFDAMNTIANWKGDPETGFGQWNVSLQSVIIPVAAFPDPTFQKDMKEEFGFENFNLAFDASALITGKDKKLNLGYGFRLKGEQIGDFEFAFAGEDIPAALASVLKEMQGGKQPNMGKLMPLVIGIKFAKLKLRFVDDNFTAKMLKFAAKKEGTTVENLTANGAAMLQIGLAQLNLPEFTKSVVGAYNAFVKNPQNISFEASPESPVAMATLMGMIAAPAAAVKMLGIKVEANK